MQIDNLPFNKGQMECPTDWKKPQVNPKIWSLANTWPIRIRLNLISKSCFSKLRAANKYWTRQSLINLREARRRRIRNCTTRLFYQVKWIKKILVRRRGSKTHLRMRDWYSRTQASKEENQVTTLRCSFHNNLIIRLISHKKIKNWMVAACSTARCR